MLSDYCRGTFGQSSKRHDSPRGEERKWGLGSDELAFRIPSAVSGCLSTHRLPYNLRMLRRDLEQGSRRAAGLDGSVLPIADGAEGDAQHVGEAFLGDIDLPADVGRLCLGFGEFHADQRSAEWISSIFTCLSAWSIQ